MAILAATLLCGAGPVVAESPAANDPPAQATAPNRSAVVELGATTAPAKARVSMSAEEQAGKALPPSRAKRGAGAGEDGLPLTRAAARQRVDTMSPAAWLAHFGPVAIERHE